MKRLPTLVHSSNAFSMCSKLFVCTSLFFFARPMTQGQWIAPGTTSETLDSASTLSMIGVTALRAQYPGLDGTGVGVAQPEVPAGEHDFEVDPSYVAQPVNRFTYTNENGQTANIFPNSIGEAGQHANIVGAAFYGQTNSNPEGVAPGLSHVDNYQALYFYDSPITLGNAISAKVVNQSFILGPNPSVIQSYDNYSAAFGTIFVSGVGNGGSPNAPATSYNGIGVAAFGGSSSVGPTTDNGRSNPTSLRQPHSPAIQLHLSQVRLPLRFRLRAPHPMQMIPGWSKRCCSMGRLSHSIKQTWPSAGCIPIQRPSTRATEPAS